MERCQFYVIWDSLKVLSIMESEEVDISLPVSGLQGDISLPVVEKKEEDSGTLDEPVLTTLVSQVF